MALSLPPPVYEAFDDRSVDEPEDARGSFRASARIDSKERCCCLRAQLFFLSPELLQMQDIGYQNLDKLGRDDGHVPSWLGGLTKSKPALQPPQPGNRSFRRGCPSRCHRAAKTGRGRKPPRPAPLADPLVCPPDHRQDLSPRLGRSRERAVCFS